MTAPEPSADAMAWRERIETAIAATNEKRTSPLLSCPELTVHGLLDEAMDHWTDAPCPNCAAADQRDSLRAELKEAVALVRRPAEDSLVTTSDDPGCFYCDQSGKHAKGCPARAFLAKHKEKPDGQA